MDEKGIVTDRRAGRIPDEKCAELCKILSEKLKAVDGIKVFIQPGKSHRFVALFRGAGLSDRLTDADPQKEGKKVMQVTEAKCKGCGTCGGFCPGGAIWMQHFATPQVVAQIDAFLVGGGK
jgi:2,3-bisphosphoglycerate-independent phosphoglycerate mutase